MAGISSRATNFGIENQKKFNDGTELNNDFGVSFYETSFRMLDPQIGRFWQIDGLAEIAYENSPFVYASNNPILINDPSGLKDSVINGERIYDVKTLKGVTVTSTKKVKAKKATTEDKANWQQPPMESVKFRSTYEEYQKFLKRIQPTICIVFPFPIYRGGPTVMPRRGVDYKVGPDGFVTGRGPSVSSNPLNSNVQKYGGAYEVEELPQGLTLKNHPVGSEHYEIVPSYPMKEVEYLELMKKVILSNKNTASQYLLPLYIPNPDIRKPIEN